MNERIIIDMLTPQGVSVKTQRYLVDDGVEYLSGESNRCAYVNSGRGRAEIAVALCEPYLSAVMAVWGGTPTVTEPDSDAMAGGNGGTNDDGTNDGGATDGGTTDDGTTGDGTTDEGTTDGSTAEPEEAQP